MLNNESELIGVLDGLDWDLVRFCELVRQEHGDRTCERLLEVFREHDSDICFAIMNHLNYRHKVAGMVVEHIK